MKKLTSFALFGAVSFVATQSYAQADAALAEQLFRDAQVLMADHKTAEACPKFAESQRLAPTLGTQLNLARCHEENGQVATAWGEYVEVARLSRNANDMQRATIAKDRAAELEKKLSKVSIKTDSKDKLTIKIDGVQLSSAVIGTTIPLDPGTRSIEVTAPDRKPWSTTVEVQAGPSEQSLTIPELTVADKPIEAPPPVIEQPSNTMRTVGIVLGAVGVVGLGVGGFFGLQAMSKNDDANAACPNPRACPSSSSLATAQTDYDDGKSAATISTIGMIAGGALLVTGIVLVVMEASKTRNPHASASAAAR